ncbi:transposable element Tcb2 transposase [Trichonephila clavipes]|nr:transposable element Tcb2 transposase [Trichonephila clavipes]
MTKDGLLCLGGRLQKSDFNFYEKHPLILPSKSRFSELLIVREHQMLHHAGITTPLPENRIQAEFPFETVGIDFEGPIYTKNDEKAFRRFIAGRGICHTVNTAGPALAVSPPRAKRKTTKREDRRIVRQALVDPTVSRSTIRVDVGVAIVPQTISRHLAEANLKSKRPFRALPLTPEHRQLRLQWCQARSMWNVTDWQKVVFSDESWFVLGTDDNRVRCGGVPTLLWPTRSPDLSPVEHVWDQLKRQMPSCHSVHDLELAVQDLWTHLPQDNIRCLINSMPDRVAACIAAGGDPTRY